MVDGGLDHLYAWGVVRADYYRIIRQPLADDFAPVVAHDAHRQQPSATQESPGHLVAGFGQSRAFGLEEGLEDPVAQ
jgi:hypothetical protein